MHDPALIAEKNKRSSAGSWIYLVKIGLEDNAYVFRVTNHNEEVTFEGDVYYPFPIAFGETQQDSQGNLPIVSLTVSNVSREISSFLEYYNGLRNEEIEVRLINTENLAIPNSAPPTTFKVEFVKLTETAAVFQLGMHPEVQDEFPFRKFSRNHCGETLGGEGCGWGYVQGLSGINPPAGVPHQTFCMKTKEYCAYLGSLYSQT